MGKHRARITSYNVCYTKLLRENRLLDPEIAYLLLRDADPEFVRALSAPDAMTIPANTDEGMTPRPAQSGPVFSSDAAALHMRYTARTRSIAWRADAATQAAVQRLREILEAASPYVFTLRLAPGQGLVCNNVLHDRITSYNVCYTKLLRSTES